MQIKQYNVLSNNMTTAHRPEVIHNIVGQQPVVLPGLPKFPLGSRSGSIRVWTGCSLWGRSKWHSSSSDGSRPLRQPVVIKVISIGCQSLYYLQLVDTLNEEADVTSFSVALMTAERRRLKGSSVSDAAAPSAPGKQARHSC